MITVVIRNKNEAEALKKTLGILTSIYAHDIHEIIIVDNNSTDKSLTIAKQFNCKIVEIDNFTYGKATNLGIQNAKTDFVLLLSAHAIPVGKSFFKNSLEAIANDQMCAGIRYINSVDNYVRALENNFKVIEPLQHGLMTACSLINKKVWVDHPFDEQLVFSEDKEWSDRVMKSGFNLLDLNETFFYFAKPSQISKLNRFKNETIATYQLSKQIYPTKKRIIASFLKKIFITNSINYSNGFKYDFLVLKAKLDVYKKLKDE